MGRRGVIERICIVGAGVIGGLLAGHLARIRDVSVLTRRAEHARALQRAGLRISGKHDFTAELRATWRVEELPPPDLAIVATKATDVAAVADALRGHHPSTTVMCIQNGLGAEAVLAAQGPWPLISGVTFMSGTRHADGHVEYELDTPTWIAPFAPQPADTEAVAEVAALLAEAGLRAEAMPDVRPAQWSKLIFNAGVSAVSALTELPHVELFAAEDREHDLGHLVHRVMEEGMAVARGAGIELHDDPWAMNLLAVKQGVSRAGAYEHLPSMLEDVFARRRTEIDFITGALIREARRVGVPVPLNEALYRLVRAKEASWGLHARPTRASGRSAA